MTAIEEASVQWLIGGFIAVVTVITYRLLFSKDLHNATVFTCALIGPTASGTKIW